jgi:hypothetical protein
MVVVFPSKNSGEDRLSLILIVEIRLIFFNFFKCFFFGILKLFGGSDMFL